jgi:hypothetical protein
MVVERKSITSALTKLQARNFLLKFGEYLLSALQEPTTRDKWLVHARCRVVDDFWFDALGSRPNPVNIENAEKSVHKNLCITRKKSVHKKRVHITRHPSDSPRHAESFDGTVKKQFT